MIAVVFAAFDVEILPSTYVFTDFTLGNFTSEAPSKTTSVLLFAVFSFSKSAAVRAAVSAAKFVVNVASALVRFVTSAAKLVVKVASAFVRLDTSAAKLLVKTRSAAALIAASLFNPVVPAVVLASTYVLTAFCVGNNTSLVPKAVAVDLFAAFSFRPNAVVVAVSFASTSA